MKGTLPTCLNQCILPAMTYGVKTWTLTTKMENTLSAAQQNMERNMLNITYKDGKTNKSVRGQTKVMDIMEIIKNRNWTWAGHISRRTDNRWRAALTETFGGNMLRHSSWSGLFVAEDDDVTMRLNLCSTINRYTMWNIILINLMLCIKF